MKRLVFLALLTGFAVLGVTGVGCQIYDFQLVSQGTLSQTDESFPLTPPLKPNLWLLVDKSGSMSSNDSCTGSSCETRLSALKNAMANFLSASRPDGKDYRTVARMALSFFPASSDACAAANSAAVPLPAPWPDDDVSHDQALRDNAAAISSQIGSVTAGGGTPTTASVEYVGGQPGLLDPDDGRDDFILLLTDGLPNCNPNNPQGLCGCIATATTPYTCTSAQETSCHCTNGPGKCGSSTTTCKGCLDKSGAAAQIASLKVKGIRTIVLGFGPDITTGDAPETLAAMATAGGGNFRTCTADAACGGGDSCVVPAGGGLGLCHRQYYKAANAGELAQMLADISGHIRIDPCSFPLTQGKPDSEKTIAVLVNGQDVRPGPTTWSYSGNNVVFAASSTYCADIKAQKPGMTLRVRYVSTL